MMACAWSLIQATKSSSQIAKTVCFGQSKDGLSAITVTLFTSLEYLSCRDVCVVAELKSDHISRGIIINGKS